MRAMLTLLLFFLSLSPRSVVPVVTDSTTERRALLAIGWRESRLRPIARHKVDHAPKGWSGDGLRVARRVGRRAWLRAVQRGLLDPACQPLGEPADWSSRGAWGQVAAYAVPYLPPCSPPWVLDVPLVSAWVALQRLRFARRPWAPRALRIWAGRTLEVARNSSASYRDERREVPSQGHLFTMYDNIDRPFILYRHEDVAGISGTGFVAAGMRRADGSADVWWLGKHRTRTRHTDMISVVDIHCHGGRTDVRWSDLVNGQWTIPFGPEHERFAWTTAHTPMGGGGWIYCDGPTEDPRWHGKVYESFVSRIEHGDHLFGVDVPGSGQVLVGRGVAEDRDTLVRLLAQAKVVYVSRIVPETGGAPAAVKIRIARESAS